MTFGITHDLFNHALHPERDNVTAACKMAFWTLPRRHKNHIDSKTYLEAVSLDSEDTVLGKTLFALTACQ
jgi:hypothetical protein